MADPMSTPGEGQREALEAIYGRIQRDAGVVSTSREEIAMLDRRRLYSEVVRLRGALAVILGWAKGPSHSISADTILMAVEGVALDAIHNAGASVTEPAKETMPGWIVEDTNDNDAGADVEWPSEPADEERIYPCDLCSTMRTKAEGGTVFTVCEACWAKVYPAAPATPEAPSAPAEPAERTDLISLREQAESWESVWDLCENLGMDPDELSGEADVLTFIRGLYDRAALSVSTSAPKPGWEVVGRTVISDGEIRHEPVSAPKETSEPPMRALLWQLGAAVGEWQRRHEEESGPGGDHGMAVGYESCAERIVQIIDAYATPEPAEPREEGR